MYRHTKFAYLSNFTFSKVFIPLHYDLDILTRIKPLIGFIIKVAECKYPIPALRQGVICAHIACPIVADLVA